MAKLVTSPISNFNVPALTTIQNNFDAIEAAIENTVSRDGSTPNQMQADLDLNKNDLLNVKSISAVDGMFDGLTISGVKITPSTELTRIESEFKSPVWYGASGDGVVNDDTGYSLAESNSDVVLLPNGKTFNLTVLPTKRVVGPGRIKYRNGSSQSATVGGLSLSIDPIQSNIISAPDIWAEKAVARTSSPGTDIANYFNVILSPGSQAGDISKPITRSTAVGHAIGEDIIEWERNDAFGNGAMRFAERSQRSTAIGTLVMQWAGASSRQKLIDNYHDFFLTTLPNNPSWNFMGMETINPGIGQKIWDFANYATSIAHSSGNVGLGRDAMLHIVRGTFNTAGGYQSLTNLFSGNENTAFGAFALRDGVFTDQSVGIGAYAGASIQEGSRNVVIGWDTADNVGSVSNLTAIGSLALHGVTTANGLAGGVFLGYQAGQGLAGYDRVLAVQYGAARKPLVSGRFNDLVAGINIDPADIKASAFHVRFGDSGATSSPSSSSNHMVLESDTSFGVSILAPSGGGYWFNNGSSTSPQAGVFYTPSTGTVSIRANTTTRMNITGTGVGFNGKAAVAPATLTAATDATSTQTLANAIRTLLINNGLAI